MPNAPLPANKSRQRAPSIIGASQLNRVSRTRSAVGRKVWVDSNDIRRPRQRPPIIRTLPLAIGFDGSDPRAQEARVRVEGAREHRLPTAAEWEFACRAGTTTAYHWGDDPKGIKDYGWYEDNSDWKYQMVAQKKPNPYGLYDMHGNVWEWVLDGYSEDAYKAFAGDPVEVDPVSVPTSLYPRTVRGGSWDDPVDRLRSAARLGSEPNWKKRDPQIPKSVWYHTDAHWIGFRMVRPNKIPPPDQLHLYWPTRVELEGIPGR